MIKFLTSSYFSDFESFNCHQSIDEKYFVSSNTGDFKVVAVTHIWESVHDPDPFKEQFKAVKRFLQEGLIEASTDIVVFYDYSCIPQRVVPLSSVSKDWGSNKSSEFHTISHGFSNDSNKKNKALKKQMNSALEKMADLYSGILADTLVYSLHTHKRTLERGWPFFELSLAGRCGILKNSHHLLPLHLRYLLLVESATEITYGQLQEIIVYANDHHYMEICGAATSMLNEIQRRVNDINTRARNKEITAADLDLFNFDGGLTMSESSKTFNLHTGTEFAISHDNGPHIVKHFLDKIKKNIVYKGNNAFPLQSEIEKKLKHSIHVELCFSRFTNGSDAEKVKNMIRDFEFPTTKK